MKRGGRVVVFAAFLLAVAGVATVFFTHHNIPVLQPAGEIGHKERGLIMFTAGISLVVVVPVFIMLGMIAWRYREGNARRGRYDPKLEGSGKLEAVWWMIPAVMITIIGVITWSSSYALDPFKPLAGAKTEHIQVVALDWKWLFIYPEERVASVNIAYVPVGTPVEFDITSDTVMTSFWAPQLGGQMYAMPGMVTKLNLRADKPGQYRGVAANISGKGFAEQTFSIGAVQPRLFPESLSAMRAGPSKLTAASYAALAKPGTLPAGAVRYYSSVDPNLYDTIVMKYMMPTSGDSGVGTVGVSF